MPRAICVLSHEHESLQAAAAQEREGKLREEVSRSVVNQAGLVYFAMLALILQLRTTAPNIPVLMRYSATLYLPLR